MNAVDYRLESGLAIISLANSRDSCFLNAAVLDSLELYLERAAANPLVRAIALRSAAPAGGPFCHGMDLEALSNDLAANNGKRRIEDAVAAFGRVLEALAFGPKPSIALVNGSVKAGGVGLVAACDFVLAAATASFELSEVLFGLIPANVLPYLINFRLSPAKAKFWTLAAWPVSAQSAWQDGLVDILVTPATAESELKTLCKQLWRAEPGAAAAAKRLFRDATAMTGSELRNYARAALLDRLTAPATAEGLGSLGQGYSPAWFAKFKPVGPVW